MSGFKARVSPKTESAKLIRDWLENDTFAWLVTVDILERYALGTCGLAPQVGQSHGLPVRKRDLLHQPVQSSIPGAHPFHLDGLAHGFLKVALAHVAGPKPTRRHGLDHPGLHLATVTVRLEENFNVGISPVDFRECTGQREIF